MTENGLAVIYNRSHAEITKWKTSLIDFVNTLKAEPTKEEIKINQFADNSKYIPIGIVEGKLDHFFNGLWETKDFKWQVIVNEIVCSIQLRVFHPDAGTWIERTGTAAVQIQLKAEYEMIDGKRVKKPVDVLDVSKKIVNTLQKDLPHAKAEAIKNATKSLGEIFGRNLNREFEDHTEIMTVEDAEIKITSIEDKAELNTFYNSLPSVMKSDKRIKKLLLDQQTLIKNKQ